MHIVSANEAYFPLGYAHGHVRDAAVSVPDLAGRGFANQEILEELASRGELSKKVCGCVAVAVASVRGREMSL